jgi:hypothetical protein
MAASKALIASPLVDLAPWLTGRLDNVAFGVGYDGAIYAASRSSSEPDFVDERGGRFPKTQLDPATEWTIVRWREAIGPETVVVRDPINVSHVQPYPGGILLVGARCRYAAGVAEQNALAIDWAGRVVCRFTLGDGIADVRSLADGTIWVSYFDEGVFGNYGWGEGAEPLGAPGLVAFSPAGERVRAFDAAAVGLDQICDVYAMTLAGNNVWIYYYTEFPIVRVGPTDTQAWAYGGRGAHAMAVDGSRVLLVGDYDDRANARVIELRRDGTRSKPKRFHLVGPGGRPLDQARCVGAGDGLYVLRGGEVLVVREW